MQTGLPPRLYGKPIFVVPKLPAITTTGKPIWFGDWQSFLIRDVRNVELMVYRERFMHQRKLGYQAFGRFFGIPLFPLTAAATRKPLRCIKATT